MKREIDEQYIRAAELVARYLQEEISPEELQELIELTKRYPALQSWLEERDLSLQKLKERASGYQSIDMEGMWQSVLNTSNHQELQRDSLKKWWAIAASIIAVCLIGGTILLNDINTNELAGTKSQKVELVPGREVATLTLSDGSTVQLGASGVRKVVDGNITLDATGSVLNYQAAKDTDAQPHKLHVPFGGTYQIQLADGTKVWLNSDSDLEFPSAFVGAERKVKVRGEAYFEIAKDPSKPFKVEVGDTEVMALGTAFNINTHLYKGKIKTILTEGTIQVSTPGQSKIIEHGYQTVSGQGAIEVGKADVEEALAWKEGYFYFNSKSLKEVLDDIARWYKVEVVINVSLSEKRYIGGIKKSESIDAVCAVLSDLTSYSIVVEDQKLIIK